MMSQTNLYSSSHVEKSPQEITMSAIASRLREIHAKMRRKEPPLPFAEDVHTKQENVSPVAKPDTHIDTRLDEINKAILFEYQERQNNEKIISCALDTILTRLDEMREKDNVAALTEPTMSPSLFDTLCERLEEQFFKKQQTALDRLSGKIEQLSRDLREAIAASRNNMQLKTLESEIHKVHALFKDCQLHTVSSEEQSVSIKTCDETQEISKTALSVLLKGIPVQQGKQESPLEQTHVKPFDIHASARLIDAARKSR